MTKKCYRIFKRIFGNKDLCISCGVIIRRQKQKSIVRREENKGVQVKIKEFLK